MTEPTTSTGSRVASRGYEQWTATGRERPVFLDEHGRRRRWVQAGGALTGGAATLWLAGLIAGAVGFGALPTTGGVPVSAHRSRAAEPAERVVRGREVGERVHVRGLVVAQQHAARQPPRLTLAAPAGRSALDRRS
jgi:hypothetical protein